MGLYGGCVFKKPLGTVLDLFGISSKSEDATPFPQLDARSSAVRWTRKSCQTTARWAPKIWGLRAWSFGLGPS